MHGDRLIMEVEVLGDGQELEFVHDPTTGELIGQETDEETHTVTPVKAE